MQPGQNFIKVTGTAVEATAAASGGAFALAVTKEWLDIGAVVAGLTLTLVMIVYWSFKIYSTIVDTRLKIKAAESEQKIRDDIADYALKRVDRRKKELSPDEAMRLINTMTTKKNDDD